MIINFIKGLLACSITNIYESNFATYHKIYVYPQMRFFGRIKNMQQNNLVNFALSIIHYANSEFTILLNATKRKPHLRFMIINPVVFSCKEADNILVKYISIYESLTQYLRSV